MLKANYTVNRLDVHFARMYPAHDSAITEQLAIKGTYVNSVKKRCLHVFPEFPFISLFFILSLQNTVLSQMINMYSLGVKN